MSGHIVEEFDLEDISENVSTNEETMIWEAECAGNDKEKEENSPQSIPCSPLEEEIATFEIPESTETEIMKSPTTDYGFQSMLAEELTESYPEPLDNLICDADTVALVSGASLSLPQIDRGSAFDVAESSSETTHSKLDTSEVDEAVVLESNEEIPATRDDVQILLNDQEENVVRDTENAIELLIRDDAHLETGSLDDQSQEMHAVTCGRSTSASEDNVQSSEARGERNDVACRQVDPQKDELVEALTEQICPESGHQSTIGIEAESIVAEETAGCEDCSNPQEMMDPIVHNNVNGDNQSGDNHNTHFQPRPNEPSPATAESLSESNNASYTEDNSVFEPLDIDLTFERFAPFPISSHSLAKFLFSDDEAPEGGEIDGKSSELAVHHRGKRQIRVVQDIRGQSASRLKTKAKPQTGATQGPEKKRSSPTKRRVSTKTHVKSRAQSSTIKKRRVTQSDEAKNPQQKARSGLKRESSATLSRSIPQRKEQARKQTQGAKTRQKTLVRESPANIKVPQAQKAKTPRTKK